MLRSKGKKKKKVVKFGIKLLSRHLASFWTAILNFLKIPQACTGMERQEVTLSLSKAFVHYFRRLKSSQVHSFMAALTCLRSVETNLTLTCHPKFQKANL